MRLGQCFACGKILPKTRRLVTCADEQDVYVGPDCYAHILAAGAAGFQPRRGGPRLYTLEHDPKGARQGEVPA